MAEARLFRLAPEAVHIWAHYVHREGWTLCVAVRRGDETWSEAAQEAYTCLTTNELVDVVLADLSTSMGL